MKNWPEKPIYFEGDSWFNFNNLGVALCMVLNFYPRMAKGLKTKNQKVFGAKSYVCLSCRGKTDWGSFLASNILARIKLSNGPIQWRTVFEVCIPEKKPHNSLSIEDVSPIPLTNFHGKLFNLLFGSGAGTSVTIPCVLQDTCHIHWLQPPNQSTKKRQLTLKKDQNPNILYCLGLHTQNSVLRKVDLEPSLKRRSDKIIMLILRKKNNRKQVILYSLN